MGKITLVQNIIHRVIKQYMIELINLVVVYTKTWNKRNFVDNDFL